MQNMLESLSFTFCTLQQIYNKRLISIKCFYASIQSNHANKIFVEIFFKKDICRDIL